MHCSINSPSSPSPPRYQVSLGTVGGGPHVHSLSLFFCTVRQATRVHKHPHTLPLSLFPVLLGKTLKYTLSFSFFGTVRQGTHVHTLSFSGTVRQGTSCIHTHTHIVCLSLFMKSLYSLVLSSLWLSFTPCFTSPNFFVSFLCLT